MVASKKSQTTKRTAVSRAASAKTAKSPVKRAVGKKTTKKAVARPLTWRFYVVTIGIFALAVSATLGLGLFMVKVAESQQSAVMSHRYARIANIYDSLKLDDSYQPTDSNVFGEKRFYKEDKNRTYASSKEYIHGDTVSNTVLALDTKIKAAGFSFVGEPYAGSKYTQYHYRSANGEYLRLNVSSKPRDDAIRNDAAMNRESTAAVLDMDANSGPSNVTIKVNLDDNNE